MYQEHVVYYFYFSQVITRLCVDEEYASVIGESQLLGGRLVLFKATKNGQDGTLCFVSIPKWDGPSKVGILVSTSVVCFVAKELLHLLIYKKGINGGK